MRWKMTPDDVMVVLATYGVATADQVRQLWEELTQEDVQRVERASLSGNGLDERADYAHAELDQILREKGFIDSSNELRLPKD